MARCQTLSVESRELGVDQSQQGRPGAQAEQGVQPGFDSVQAAIPVHSANVRFEKVGSDLLIERQVLAGVVDHSVGHSVRKRDVGHRSVANEVAGIVLRGDSELACRTIRTPSHDLPTTHPKHAWSRVRSLLL